VSRSEQEEKNVQIALDMYNNVLVPFDFTRAREYISEKYRQHDPMAEDGPEGLRKFLETAIQEYPHAETRILKVFAEGDHVIMHVNVILEPGTLGLAVVDIFRFEDGMIVEHWDVIQPVPETSNNDNTMF